MVPSVAGPQLAPNWPAIGPQLARNWPVTGAPRRLSVFTRAPAPGEAKTRLVPPLTPTRAAALQRAMTEDLLERFARRFAADVREGERAGSLSLEVRCDRDPADALDIPAAWKVRPQGPGDLGQRLARAAADARVEGVHRLVIVGSDAPLLPAEMVERGFSELAAREAVLAPAEDGGYVLIGAALARTSEAAVGRLFSKIPWGTGAVRRATLAAADQAGLRVGELPSWWDVDRPEDLSRLRDEIAALDPAERPRRTAAVLATPG